MAHDGYDGTVSDDAIQDLVVVTSQPLFDELGFTRNQENRVPQSLLGAVPWSARLNDPLIVIG